MKPLYLRSCLRAWEALAGEVFDGLPDPIDHVLVTAGRPHYGPLLEMDADEVRGAVTEHLLLAVTL